MPLNNAINNILQLECSAYVGSQINNVTGNGTNYQVVFNTALSGAPNTGILNLSTGLITFPRKGTYIVSGAIESVGLAVGLTQLSITVNSTLKNYISELSSPISIAIGGRLVRNFSAIVFANAGNTGSVVLNGAGLLQVVGVGVNSNIQILYVGNNGNST